MSETELPLMKEVFHFKYPSLWQVGTVTACDTHQGQGQQPVKIFHKPLIHKEVFIACADFP